MVFTRANFDIKSRLACSVCKQAVATRIVTNTVVNFKKELSAHPFAFCINCWNETMEIEEE